ncbi:hypothetical protein AWC38_SpisGene10081 [Stylophora pistillata]|uniref:Uncharacterized protein n=1 Tax=Stylophora pistillata TaxID=50429 RepID=A0A2B4S9P2_STYPI|nr:hypothetical protein AWC38_SpisGene10081 [Stylophora pistillata]
MDEATKAELIWAMKMVGSHYSYASCDNIKETLDAMFPGKIPNNFTMSSSKVSYLISEVTGPYFKKIVTDDVKKNSGSPFTLQYDETTNALVNKQLDIKIRYWSSAQSKIVVQHLQTYLMGHATGLHLAEKIISTFHDSGIALEQLQMLESDGPNVNTTVWNIVNDAFLNFPSRNYGLTDIDTCDRHICHNAFTKGLEVFGSSISEFVIDLHLWFKMSAARREDYEVMQEEMGLAKHKFLKHVECRWLSLQPAVLRILEQLEGLKREIGKFSEEKQRQFVLESKSFVIAATKHLVSKLPLDNILRSSKALKPDAHSEDWSLKAIKILAKKMKVSVDLEKLSDEWRIYQLETITEDRYKEFEEPQTFIRVDHFWRRLDDLKDVMGEKKFPSIMKVVKTALILLDMDKEKEEAKKQLTLQKEQAAQIEAQKQQLAKEKKDLNSKEKELERQEAAQQECMEVGDTILKEANAKLRDAMRNKDFKEVSVAQAMIEAAQKKISSANKAMQQTREQQKSVLKRKQNIINTFLLQPRKLKLKKTTYEYILCTKDEATKQELSLLVPGLGIGDVNLPCMRLLCDGCAPLGWDGQPNVYKFCQYFQLHFRAFNFVEWSRAEVKEWALSKSENENIANKFEEEEIDGSILLSLTVQTTEVMDKLGLTTIVIVSSSAESTQLEPTPKASSRPKGKLALPDIKTLDPSLKQIYLSVIRRATEDEFPGDAIPTFRNNPDAKRRLQSLVKQLSKTCTIKEVYFGEVKIRKIGRHLAPRPSLKKNGSSGKAFNTISHELLPLKLQAVGIIGDSYNWILDYLKDRSQFTKVNGSSSSTKAINYGVPQVPYWDQDCIQFIEAIMAHIDKLRAQANYSHPRGDCTEDCNARECYQWTSPGKLSSCLHSASVHGMAFCQEHLDFLSSRHPSIPTDIRGFLKHCGVLKDASAVEVVDNITLTTDETHKVESVVDSILDTASTPVGQSAVLSQENGEILSQANSGALLGDCAEEAPKSCNRETGEKKHVQKWSSGDFLIVRGSGFIDKWNPLFRSESPSQAFLIIINWLLIVLKDFSPSSWGDIYLAYVDGMKAASKPLPLPPPLDKMWSGINKLIDTLHLKNHRDPQWKTKYNPAQLKEELPNVNTMEAEQTFVWLSRFKKILFAMPKVHHLFSFTEWSCIATAIESSKEIFPSASGGNQTNEPDISVESNVEMDQGKKVEDLEARLLQSEKELAILREKNEELKRKITEKKQHQETMPSPLFSLVCFKSDADVNFHTDLPNHATLISIFEFFNPGEDCENIRSRISSDVGEEFYNSESDDEENAPTTKKGHH